MVSFIEAGKVNIHPALVKIASGQLPFPGPRWDTPGQLRYGFWGKVNFLPDFTGCVQSQSP
jgi:hypothetical protein